MSPSDVVLDEILGLLNRDSAKNEIKRWFRYERNILSPSIVHEQELEKGIGSQLRGVASAGYPV